MTWVGGEIATRHCIRTQFIIGNTVWLYTLTHNWIGAGFTVKSFLSKTFFSHITHVSCVKKKSLKR